MPLSSKEAKQHIRQFRMSCKEDIDFWAESTAQHEKDYADPDGLANISQEHYSACKKLYRYGEKFSRYCYNFDKANAEKYLAKCNEAQTEVLEVAESSTQIEGFTNVLINENGEELFGEGEGGYLEVAKQLQMLYKDRMECWECLNMFLDAGIR